jgi:hypothetical protein
MPKKKPIPLRITAPLIDINRMAAEMSERWKNLTPEQRSAMDKELDAAYPNGFTERDEANALIAMVLRNGPLEDLHAGKYSALLEDASLSRITDEEMKVLMIGATRLLAGLLRAKANNPDFYHRWMKTYGRMYCQRWERE